MRVGTIFSGCGAPEQAAATKYIDLFIRVQNETQKM